MPKAARKIDGKLTTLAIDAMTPDGQRHEIPDAGCAGLYLFILPSGTRSWYARYRNTAGKQCRLALGTYPDVGLAKAHEAADRVRQAVREGRDPAAEKVIARDRAKMEAERLALGEVVKASDPFSLVWAQFDAEHITPTFRPGTATLWRRVYKRTLAPRWDNIPLAEITAADVYGMQRTLQKKPAAADTALTVVKAFFNWTIAAPRHLIQASPVAGIAKVKRSKEDSDTNDRTLTDDELRWCWKACGMITPQFGNMIKLLILTGARRREVSDLAVSELDTNNALWTLPAIRSKNGRALVLNLSAESLEVLEETPRVKNDGGFVFCTNGDSPVSGFSKFKDALDAAMVKVATSERGEPVTIPAWRLHDIRRTFATGLARLGVSLQVAERCLNHSSGTLGGLAGVYNKHEYRAEQKAAWEAWSRHVAGIVSDQAGNVVQLIRA